MKKLLIFLLVCFSSTLMFAQAPALHYTVENVGSLNMTMYTMISIDDVLQNVSADDGSTTGVTEIGVFDQNGKCRYAGYPSWKKKAQRWVYGMAIQGNAGFTYSFKLYDHSIEQELALTCDEDGTIAFYADSTFASTGDPMTLHFHTATTVETRDLTINGYGEDNPTGGYYLIASPFDGVKPVDVANMIDTNPTDYDLYSFDQAESLEWRNYKQGNFTTLVSGQGYLYARKATATLTFTGTVFNGPTKDVDIYYVEEAPHATSKGWNLVGNPFTDENAYIEDGRNYYTLNETGSGINATSSNGAIAPMTAVFVESSVAGETITFTTDSGKKGAELALNLSKDSKLVDRAIVRFDGNRNMRKFQLFENSTKLYIEQDNKDYAVVSADAQGEVPVSFKAEKNGNYTLSFNTENVEFGYLHLIDNLTGNEVDLLASPSYSFEATTSDYASRFRLVFATSDAANSQFAFVGNGEIFLTGQGNVQVYDVTGRLIGSHNEVTHFSTNGMSAGVYMLQLSNGSDVKTQKIVVK
jgi:hypothetical protein